MDAPTIKAYDALAKEYDAETAPFWDEVSEAFAFVKEFVSRARGSVLDIGSGAGRDGKFLQQSGLAVTCLDASEAMVAMTRAKGLESVQADFKQLPFNDGTFDSVWAYTSLLHLPKDSIDIPLKEIQRVLKPGGLFALGMIEGDDEGYRISSGMQMERWFSFYSKEELEKIVMKHGFVLEYFTSFKPRSKNYLNFIFRRTDII